MGKKRVPPLSIPGEIFDVYQPTIGPNATLLWLNLRWLVHVQADGNIEELLQDRTGFSFRTVTEGLSALTECGLLEFAETGEYVVNDPLSAEAFEMLNWQKNNGTAASVDVSTPSETVGTVAKFAPQPETTVPSSVTTPSPAAEVSGMSTPSQPSMEVSEVLSGKTKLEADAPTNSVDTNQGASPLSRKNRRRITPQSNSPVAESDTSVKAEAKPEHKARRNDGASRDADMDAVVEIYHKKIGMLGPTQFDKLKFWVKEQGMSGEVVALAIEETVQSAQNPRIQYLEGILRNWYNDGIITLQDLLKHKKASKVLSGGEESQPPSMDGIPNAAAYRRVDPEMVKKWKELYPDEYDG
jgi:DnaD/phage-associated family protein